MSVFEVRVLL